MVRSKSTVSLRAQRSNLCLKPEIASSLFVPRNDKFLTSVSEGHLEFCLTVLSSFYPPHVCRA